MRFRLPLTLIVLLTLFSCGSGTTELKPIQEIKAGDYSVRILSESGAIKQGSGNFILEFRKSSDSQLVDVGKVEVSPVMDMPGMSPMMASAEVSPSDTPGRYKVASNFTMAGLWKCNITFGGGQSIRFNLNAQ